MAYRDDREAMQNRLQVLEEELGHARERAADAEKFEQEAADKQRELDALKNRLARYETPGDARRSPLFAIIAVVVIALGAVAIALARKPAESGGPMPPECEAYFVAIDACSLKNPELAKFFASRRDELRTTFKQMNASPAGLEAARSACITASTTMVQACGQMPPSR